MPKRIFKIGIFEIYVFKYMLILYYERRNSIYSAMALVPPLVLVWKKHQINNVKLYKHESIHHRQILELLIVPFFAWYLFEYLLGRLKGFNHFDSYKSISFEKEAYEGENIPKYSSKPRWFGFIKYL
jgi:hypothetical protein